MQNPDTLLLTQDLISRPSVTPADHGCQQLMMERLAAAGFRGVSFQRRMFGTIAIHRAVK